MDTKTAQARIAQLEVDSMLLHLIDDQDVDITHDRRKGTTWAVCFVKDGSGMRPESAEGTTATEALRGLLAKLARAS